MNKKFKVLLSDDGTEFTGGCTSALRSAGYEVTVVPKDGTEILNMVEKAEPDILVMDEPGAALDLSAKSMILDTIKEFTYVGKSVMITSHEIPELMICDRVYGMKNGMITQLKREINRDYLQKWIEG